MANSETDTTQITSILERLENNKFNDTNDYKKTIGNLTKYFELDPDTKKIYRKDMLIEAFKSHTSKLISTKKEKI
jgi:hypothetical protein